MKKEDKNVLIIFVILILLIICLLIYNIYLNNKREVVDRKIEYIFDKYTYSAVLKQGTYLFFNTLKLSDIKTFEYEKNNNEINYYSINDYNKYKKIINYNLINDTLSSNEINKYLKDKKIIKYDNYYYIKNYSEKINYDYIGSIIEISNYDDKKVYFKSTNYYCKNEEFQGLLEREPECSYKNNITNFTIINENDFLRIDSYNDIAKIIQ